MADEWSYGDAFYGTGYYGNPPTCPYLGIPDIDAITLGVLSPDTVTLLALTPASLTLTELVPCSDV